MSGQRAKTEKPVGEKGRKSWRTLIVDDHQLFRDGLRELLQNEPDVEFCGEAEHEEDAFKQFVDANPDLVIVDISLASGHGLNLTSRIKKASPTAIVVVLSMYDDRVYAERALAAGASGYICKQSTNREIVDAIRAVRNGEIYLQENILQRILKQKVRGRHAVKGGESEQLSARELEIFTLIGRGRTTHQIAHELRLAISTVETYRERLKTKLNLTTGSELTRYAILWVMQNT
jgi:DNA-binding NarL/FixJ family response regulator